MKLRLGLCGFLLAAVSVHAAELLTTSESADMLRRMIGAARGLNYSGIYTFQNGDVMETFRMAHVFDANGEQERRESLDGEQREFIRRGNQLICLLPNRKPFLLDQKVANKFFPGFIPEQATDVLANYSFRRYGMDRVAGYECQTFVLEPHDRLRLPHRLCVEPNSGLMLKSLTYSPIDQTQVERFAFSQIDIGGQIDARLLKPSNPAALLTLAPANAQTGASQSSGMGIANVPSGFHLVKETQNQMHGRAKPVHHYVFSDGLASVSVFVEPLDNGPVTVPIKPGRISYVSREVQGWRVTVVGEVPPQTVQMFAQAFEPH